MLTTVVPEPKKTVSCGSIISAAAAAMASFSAAWTPTASSQRGSDVTLLLHDGAAVGAVEHALLLEQQQVAADGDLRDAEVLAQRGDADGALVLEGRDDARATLCGQHLSRRRCRHLVPL